MIKKVKDVKKKSCLVIPQFLYEQDYIENQKNLIRASNTDYEILHYENLLDIITTYLTKGFTKIDLVVINWFENKLLVSNNVRKVSFFSLFKGMVFFLLLRVISKKLIYIKHNSYPHELKTSHIFICKFFIEIAEKLSDKVACHSNAPVYNKYSYVPHPLPKIKNNNGCSDQNGSYFCIVGRISYYKGIHNLIPYWNCRQKLVVIGNAEDKDYFDNLLLLSSFKNIEIINQFLEPEELNKIISNSLGCIFCHEGDDMIVSGGLYHVLALEKPILAISTPHLIHFKSFYGIKSLLLFDDVISLIECVDRNSYPLEFTDWHFFERYSDSYVQYRWDRLLS